MTEQVAKKLISTKGVVADALAGGLPMVQAAKHALYLVAERELDRHWKVHEEENRGLKPWEKSILGVRIMGAPGEDFYINWYWNKWYRDAEGRYRPLSRHIRKGRGVAYPESTLRRFAKDWEIDRVLSVERELAAVREELREIKRIEMVLRRILARWPSVELSEGFGADESADQREAAGDA